MYLEDSARRIPRPPIRRVAPWQFRRYLGQVMQKPSVATHRRGQNCAHYAIELSKELTNRRSPITTVDPFGKWEAVNFKSRTVTEPEA